MLVQRLLGFALDGEAPDALAVAAIRDALDRTGLNTKTAVEVEVKPWAEVMEGIAGIDTWHWRSGTPSVDPPYYCKQAQLGVNSQTDHHVGGGCGANIWAWSHIVPEGVSFCSLSRQAKGFITRSPGAPANAMEIRGEADVSRATR